MLVVDVPAGGEAARRGGWSADQANVLVSGLVIVVSVAAAERAAQQQQQPSQSSAPAAGSSGGDESESGGYAVVVRGGGATLTHCSLESDAAGCLFVTAGTRATRVGTN